MPTENKNDKVIFFCKSPKGKFSYKKEERYGNGDIKEPEKVLGFESHLFVTNDPKEIEFMRDKANNTKSPSHQLVFECKDMKEFSEYRQAYLLERSGMTSVSIENALDETHHSEREIEIMDRVKITGRK